MLSRPKYIPYFIDVARLPSPVRFLFLPSVLYTCHYERGQSNINLTSKFIASIMGDNFLDMPVMDPPPGQVQNIENPPNKNNTVIAIYTVCIVLVSVFVALRLYAKFAFMKAPRVQDCKVPSLPPVSQRKSYKFADLIVPTYVRSFGQVPDFLSLGGY